MTAHCGWCTFPSTGRIRPFRVHRPNWKAECVERCLLRLEGGKDCKVLPILTHPQVLIRAYVSALIANALFLGDQVIETTVCNECWSGLLFAGRLQLSVGPFAMSISREAFLFAMIVGRKVSLFASPRRTVRKPLVRHEVA